MNSKLEYLFVLVHTLIIILVGPALGVPILLYLIYAGSIYRYLGITYLVYTFFTWDNQNDGGSSSTWLKTSVYTKLLQSYFPMKIIKTADIPQDKNYILGIHPHGLLTYAALTYMNMENEQSLACFGKLKQYFCTAKYNMQVPIQRDYFQAIGSVSASEKSIMGFMTKSEGGNLLGLVIGGPKEVFQPNRSEMHLILKNRKGFCRVALKSGCSLVPSFSFGENELFECVEFPETSVIRRLQRYICNNFHVALPILKGSWKYQYFFAMPKRVPITAVIGKPIHTKQVNNPTEEQIDALHSSYVQSLIELYDEHKAKYNLNPNTELVID